MRGNWFIKLCQQYNFPFAYTPQEPVSYTSEDVLHGAPYQEEDLYWDEEMLEEYLDTEQNPLPFLQKYDIDYQENEFPTGKKVITIMISSDPYNWYIVEEENGRYRYSKNAYSWILNNVNNSYEFYPEKEDFWNDIGPGSVVYHATQEEHVPLILKEGLECRNETRGISNRWTPCAVFASWNTEAIDSYGTSIFSIDLGKMKADGYMPNVELEKPVSEAEIEEALAAGIGIEDYYAEVEHGLDPETVVIYGDIPAKYLELVE